DELTITNGGLIEATASLIGNGGSIFVDVDGPLVILAAGAISTHTSSSGHGGNIDVHAGSLFIDSENVAFTGLAADSLPGSTGDAGNINVIVDGALSIYDAAINAHTSGSGRGGDVTIHAGSLTIDGTGTPGFFCGVAADSLQGATGAAGNIDITLAGAL